MYVESRGSRQKSWQTGRQRVSVLAELAIRKEIVATKLAQLRDAHDLTQERAAAHVGVTVRQWQRWETGVSVPYPRNLDAIAEKFGISVAEFFDAPREVPAENGRPPSQLDRIEAKLDVILSLLGATDDQLDAAVQHAIRGLAAAPVPAAPVRAGRGSAATRSSRA